MAGTDLEEMHTGNLEDLARSITYRDGYSLEVSGSQMRWVFNGADNYGRYEFMTVNHQWFTLNPEDSLERSLGMIFTHLAYVEDHEMRERFKVRGKSVYNPHRRGAQIKIQHLLPDEVNFVYYGDGLR
jgi:hypothetical protein